MIKIVLKLLILSFLNLNKIERNSAHTMIEIRHSNDANLLYTFFGIIFRLELFDTKNYSIILQFYGRYS